MGTWLGLAKRRDQTLGRIAYDNGQNVPRRLELRNSGYLEQLRLWVETTSTYTTAGPTGVDAMGQFAGPVNRFTVVANSVGLIYDCSGFMTAIISGINAQYNYGTGSVTPTPPYAFNASPGTSATTNRWAYEIPVALNLANKPWPIGLFQTAINSQEVSLEVRWNPIAGTAGNPGSCVYTGNAGNLSAANQSGFVEVQQVYFDPIADPEAQPNLAFVHTWREFQVPISADGDLEIRLPPSNLYLRVILALVTGASGALALDNTSLTRLRLMYGSNLAPYDESIHALRLRMTRHYGFSLPNGVYIYDFLEETHTERDIINSAGTTDLRVVLTTQGATYTGGAHVRVAVEQLVPLAAPVPGTAGPQGMAA
jgi:hypothetical protein